MFDLGYTLTLVMIGTFILGIFGGFLGSIIVLRRQALIGDALAHATLPGVMFAFILFSTRSLNILLIGAFISALMALALMQWIRRYTILGWDATMALLLSGFFGLGQWLLSIIQRQGLASQGGLNRFIFGQAATMLRADVITLAVLSSLLLFILLSQMKAIQTFVFDRTHYTSLGFKAQKMEGFISLATLIFIVLGIRLVGVILVSAMLIGPALIARQWTQRFAHMVFLAAMVGGVSGAIGTYLSASVLNAPTGPVIVLVLGSVFLLSLLFAPREGILSRGFITHRLKRNIRYYQGLIHLYENPLEKDYKKASIEALIKDGYVTASDQGWALTDLGKKRVETLKRGILDES